MKWILIGVISWLPLEQVVVTGHDDKEACVAAGKKYEKLPARKGKAGWFCMRDDKLEFAR